MGMTIDKAIEFFDGLEGHTPQAKDARNVAIDTMRKYQTMQEVLEKVWNVPSCMLDEAECLNKIMEIYRTVRW